MRGQTAGTRFPKKSPTDGEAQRQRVERVKTWRAEMRGKQNNQGHPVVGRRGIEGG